MEIDIEKIKLELRIRTMRLDLPEAPSNPDPIEAIKDRMTNVSKLSEIATRKIADVLNQILVEDGIDFENEIEKQKFLAQIKPTFAEILKEKINDAF